MWAFVLLVWTATLLILLSRLTSVSSGSIDLGSLQSLCRNLASQHCCSSSTISSFVVSLLYFL